MKQLKNIINNNGLIFAIIVSLCLYQLCKNKSIERFYDDDNDIKEKLIFKNFYLEECKYSKDWRKLEDLYKNDKYISIRDINCSRNQKECQNHYLVLEDFPIIYIRKGNDVMRYDGPKKLKEMVDFVEYMKSRYRMREFPEDKGEMICTSKCE